MLRIFIGYDPKENVAYHVLSHSIMRRSSSPVSITPIMADQLTLFTRERDPLQSTEFSFTRFMTPYLSDYMGWSLFIDCDMICLADISKLFELVDPTKAVQVIKHDYTPKTKTKFLGNVQTKYEKKNWSSVMLFNNAKCRALTPTYVNQQSGLDLHQFMWLDSDDLIGELPAEWGHLVGEYQPNPNAKMVHYTLGGPYFSGYEDCEYARVWFKELMEMKLTDISEANYVSL